MSNEEKYYTVMDCLDRIDSVDNEDENSRSSGGGDGSDGGFAGAITKDELQKHAQYYYDNR